MLKLVPAYGRDYKSKKALLTDWEAGKDFRICDISSPDDGRLVNLEDALHAGIAIVNIRYKKLTQVAMIKVKAPKPAEPEREAYVPYLKELQKLQSFFTVGAVVESKKRNGS